MYQVSNSFLQAMDDISRTLAVEVEISGVRYPTDAIIRFELERGVFDNDTFTIGQTMSNALTLEIFTTPTIQTGDEIKLFTSLRVGETYERVPLGVYYVDSATVNKEKMTLTCYDKMVTLIDEYIPSANHTTLAALFEDVLSQIGMTYDGVFHDAPIKAPLHGYTYRETLGFIASLNGGNMVVNRAGHLEIQRFQTVERSIPAKACFSFEVKEPYRVSKVFCQFGDVGIARGDSSGQCVAFENPYVTEQNIDVIYNQLNGLSFTAATLNYRGDLTLDPGDIFQFTDYKGDIYPLMCGRNKLTFNGGLSGQLDSIGESETTNSYAESQLKYKKNITKLTAELGKIQGVVQEIEQSHDGLEERVKKAELEITADAIKSKVENHFVAKDEINGLVTEEQLQSAITQSANSITAQVSTTYETQKNVESKVSSTLNSAKSYADTKKTEAINAASTDAANKANNAKNEAIASANNTLTTTIANYYTKEETNSQINIAKDEIKLGVSQTYETKTNVETKVASTLNSAKSYADTKKNEAISSANNTLNTTIANYYTKEQTDSQINVAKDAINLGVSTNYETKANVETKINTAVNNVQVGGRNLWRFTKEYDGTKYSGWVDNNDSFPQAIAPYTTVNGFGVQRIARTWTDISQRATIEANTDYTLSAWIKWESTAGSMMFYTNTGTMSGTDVTSQVGTTDYKRVSITFNSGNATVSTCRFECNSNTPYLIYGLKLEKGTKATDWTPAPEDIDSAIDKKANSTDVYTKSETDSKITIAKDEINLGVSNVYETKETVTTKVNNAVNNIQVGGTNLWVLSDIVTGWESDGAIIGEGDAHKTRQSLIPTNGAKELVYQCWNPNRLANASNSNRVAFFDGDRNYVTSRGVVMLSGEEYQQQLIDIPSNTSYMRLGAICGVSSYDGSIKIKFELGNKATDFSPAPEDTESDITILESETKTLKESVTSLQLGTDSINASVKSLQETVTNTTNSLAQDIQSVQNQVNLAMTSDDVKIEIQKEMSKGTNKVSTSTGFTFDDSGLKVSKSDSEMATQITEDGMTVYRNDEAVLTANNQGVDAKNLRATTYLIIGSNSRMEDFTCNNNKRTAMFWIGD